MYKYYSTFVKFLLYKVNGKVRPCLKKEKAHRVNRGLAIHRMGGGGRPVFKTLAALDEEACGRYGCSQLGTGLVDAAHPPHSSNQKE